MKMNLTKDLDRLTSLFKPLLPTTCLLCGARGQSSGFDLCRNCEIDLPWNDTACFCCGLPLESDNPQLQCGECQQQPPPFSLAITPLHYQKPLANLLRNFKHRGALNQGRLLGKLLANSIRDFYLDLDDLDTPFPQAIIPVPLHWRRFWWRGYNQSIELSRQLSNELQIPCLTQTVIRHRNTPSQQGLDKKQRRNNLRNAFHIKKPIDVKCVAIVDDVVTTGSTASEIARLLLNNGVKEVHLWGVARTALK